MQSEQGSACEPAKPSRWSKTYSYEVLGPLSTHRIFPQPPVCPSDSEYETPADLDNNVELHQNVWNTGLVSFHE